MVAVMIAATNEKGHRVIHQVLSLAAAVFEQRSVDTLLELGIGAARKVLHQMKLKYKPKHLPTNVFVVSISIGDDIDQCSIIATTVVHRHLLEARRLL